MKRESKTTPADIRRARAEQQRIRRLAASPPTTATTPTAGIEFTEAELRALQETVGGMAYIPERLYPTITAVLAKIEAELARLTAK